MNKLYFIIIIVALFCLNFFNATENFLFGENINLTILPLSQLSNNRQTIITPQMEHYGDRVVKNTSTKKDDSLTRLSDKVELLNNKLTPHISKRVMRALLKDFDKRILDIESTINAELIKLYRDEKIGSQIIKGSFIDGKTSDKLNKYLYSKLSMLEMKNLYFIKRDYINMMNRIILPNIFKQLIIKRTKLKFDSSDKVILKEMLKQILNTKLDLKMSEIVFFYIITNGGEDYTLNKQAKSLLKKINPNFMKTHKSIHSIKYILPDLKFAQIDNFRLDTLLFYTSYYFTRFYKVFYLAKEISFIKHDKVLSENYRLFLKETSKFVIKVNGETVMSFKKSS